MYNKDHGKYFIFFSIEKTRVGEQHKGQDLDGRRILQELFLEALSNNHIINKDKRNIATPKLQGNLRLQYRLQKQFAGHIFHCTVG